MCLIRWFFRFDPRCSSLHLKLSLENFSKLEITDTHNVTFRTLGFLLLVDLQISQYVLSSFSFKHVNSFCRAGRKRLFFLAGCDLESAILFQLNFGPKMPHNEALVRKPLQGVPRWIPSRKHWKSKPENHSKEWMWQLRVLKEGVRKQRKIQKSILILERDFSPIYSVLNKFLANYYPKTRASERTRSFCYFAIFFLLFSQTVRLCHAFAGQGKTL